MKNVNNKARILMEAMKRDLLVPVHKGTRWHGWKLPPSVRMFKIEIKPWNDLLMQVGLKRRLKHTIKWQDLCSAGMRRYMQHEIKRLDALRDNPSEYWKLADSLIRTSVSFRVAAFNKIAPDWWHAKPLAEVWWTLRRVELLIRKRSDKLNYRRVYIVKDKANKTWRPLGVPTLPWRIVMHMWNNFLTQFLRRDLEQWNHGFQPGLGTLTAWRDFINVTRKCDYIYEFDIKQFFPSVRPMHVSSYLKASGVPDTIVSWLEAINSVLPTLPKEQKMDEHYTKVRSILEGFRSWGEQIDSFSKRRQASIMGSYDNWLRLTRKGLPQGLNTSPILSMTVLVDWRRQLQSEGVNLLMYADDGMQYSNIKFEPVRTIRNMSIHPEKSRWVKYEGKWLVDKFKFLGLEYLTKEEIIKGSTRKGSDLQFDATRKELMPLIKKLKGKAFSREFRDPMDFLANSGVFGLVQAKLYQGDWEEMEQVTKQWCRHPLSWYQASIDAQGHPTMSSIAVQYLSRIACATMKGKMHLHYSARSIPL